MGFVDVANFSGVPVSSSPFISACVSFPRRRDRGAGEVPSLISGLCSSQLIVTLTESSSSPKSHLLFVL